MRRLLTDEEGLALVPAICVSVIVLLLGAAVLSTVSVQSNQSGAEREAEGAFGVAESALNNQVTQLGRTWPAAAASAYTPCTQSTTPSATCTGTALTSNFTGTGGSVASGPNGGSDFAATPTWVTRVIDDVDGSSYYSDSLATRTPVPCACDANANGAVWVRSEAAVAGRRSVVVSLVERSAPRQETLPSSSIIAGWFNTTNNGKKVIVQAQKDSGSPVGNVSVRCSTPAPSRTDSCLGYDPSKGQLSPSSAYQTGYVDGTGIPNETNRTILDPDALARLKATAVSKGSYYPTGCPPTLAGALVYVENPTNATCSYTANAVYNSAAVPGVFIMGGGQLDLGGTSTYYGLIYNANRQGSAPASGPCTSAYQNSVLNLSGNTTIQGAIMVDKCGGVNAGSSGSPDSNGVNIIFDANVFANVASNGAAAGVKNSFRIIPAT